jgi:hypothetical protein
MSSRSGRSDRHKMGVVIVPCGVRSVPTVPVFHCPDAVYQILPILHPFGAETPRIPKAFLITVLTIVIRTSRARLSSRSSK